jgi:chromate transporter
MPPCSWGDIFTGLLRGDRIIGPRQLSGRPAIQVASIVLGGVLGLTFCRGIVAQIFHPLRISISRPVAVASLVRFLVFLVGPSAYLIIRPSQNVAFFEAFYRSGAPAFGRGHVVLPLLQSTTVGAGWVDNATFLAGYGIAQAQPGPLFSFAAYLGAVAQPPPHGALGAGIALLSIFLPGLLLLVGVLPFWDQLRWRVPTRRRRRAAPHFFQRSLLALVLRVSLFLRRRIGSSLREM